MVRESTRMLSFGIGEMMIVAGVALLVVGPERLPRVLRQLGRWYGQARRAADDLRRAFVLEADRQDASERYRQLQERRKRAEEARRRATEAAEAAEASDDDAPAPEPFDPSQPVSQRSALPLPEPGGDEPSGFDANAEPPDAPHPTRPTPAVEESP